MTLQLISALIKVEMQRRSVDNWQRSKTITVKQYILTFKII